MTTMRLRRVLDSVFPILLLLFNSSLAQTDSSTATVSSTDFSTATVPSFTATVEPDIVSTVAPVIVSDDPFSTVPSFTATVEPDIVSTVAPVIVSDDPFSTVPSFSATVEPGIVSTVAPVIVSDDLFSTGVIDVCQNATCPGNSVCVMRSNSSLECVSRFQSFASRHSVVYSLEDDFAIDITSDTPNIFSTNLTVNHASGNDGYIFTLGEYWLSIGLFKNAIILQRNNGSNPRTIAALPVNLRPSNSILLRVQFSPEIIIHVNENSSVPVNVSMSYQKLSSKMVQLGGRSGQRSASVCLKDTRLNGNILPPGKPDVLPAQHTRGIILQEWITNGTDKDPGWQSGCVDHCASIPCHNEGVCFSLRDTFQCECKSGWSGYNCTTPTCSGVTCVNGGNCSTNSSSWWCDCEKGFSGTLCDVADCSQGVHCRHNASCEVVGPQWKCNCPLGYEGRECEIPSCPAVNCSNGVCSVREERWQCDCRRGWEGLLCDEDLDECSSSMTPSVCLNNATCVNLPGSFACKCSDGYLGSTCHSTDPCGVGACVVGNCSRVINDTELTAVALCACPPLYSGSRCEAGPPSEKHWWVGLVVAICVVLFIIAILVGGVFAYRYIRSTRASQGLYKPNEREQVASNELGMSNLMKIPPEERLI